MGGDERRIQVAGTVDAPPAAFFAALSDPARHTEMDGADMVRGLDSGPSPVTGISDAWVMDMEQDGALSHIIGELDPSGHAST